MAPHVDPPNLSPISTGITRRAFVKVGGALVVTLAIPAGFVARRWLAGADTAGGSGAAAAHEPLAVASWLEIRADNTILVRTGRAEIGTGMSAVYAQTVAEELRVQPEAITLIMADTDKTPDGGYSAGFLTGAENLRKVAAYTYQALLGLAAMRLGVTATRLTVVNGIVSIGSGRSTGSGGSGANGASGASGASGANTANSTGASGADGANAADGPSGADSANAVVGARGARGTSVSYGQLVQGQHLDLQIPVSGTFARVDAASGNGMSGLNGLEVTGNPPLKPVSEYTVVGKSHPMPAIPSKVVGKMEWSCDVTLPGMLHARMVRPATLGSTLVSPGSLDKSKFPTAEIVRRANLVAVVSPNEWEAVTAAASVAANTTWTAWSGLPGSENLTRTLREYTWGPPHPNAADRVGDPPESRGNADQVRAALTGSAKVVFASYEQPYVRHAPIGPFLAVADVRQDGTVTVWTHSSNSQGLRARLAHMLGTPVEKVVVRWMDHAGQFGRTTFGGDGAEADAVILSQITGKPVRVQWSLPEDLTWSTVSPGWVSDMKAGLDAQGRLTAVQSAFYSPQMMDARPIGGILAGLPCGSSKPGGWLATEWAYDRVSHVLEQAYGMPNVGANDATGGLRGNIMRTPGQRQQNFALEALINEAAAAAGTDPVEFRREHTTDPRLIAIINETASAAGWEPRPSPHPQARRTGSDPVTGRGVGIIRRSNAYWVGIAEISVVPATGVVRATRFTIGVECGKIINPRQLDRCMRGGVVMGLSEALKEEVTFDRSTITSTDWSRYQILTMAETPEIRVVQISRDDKGFGAGGEAPNALAPAAVAAAVFDATGVQPRRIPLTPGYVKALLRGA